MTDRNSRFDAAIAAFDRSNGEDPNRVVHDGKDWPKELLYARRMTACLAWFAPDASDALKLAARAQHIRRWVMPRGDYPMGRAGYLEWRAELKRLHARLAGTVLAEVGYDAAEVARVQSLLRKERLKRDAEAQCLEDIACLVFLETGLADFAAGHDDDKIVDILRKTWRKMSAKGRAAALTLELPPTAGRLVERAIQPASDGGR